MRLLAALVARHKGNSEGNAYVLVEKYGGFLVENFGAPVCYN